MTKRVLILGAGGHGQVVADILLCARQRRGDDLLPMGFLDDDRNLWGQEFLGLPVSGGLAQLDCIEHDAVIVAIGDNAVRARVFVWSLRKGEHLANAVHPTAFLASGVTLGSGVVIAPGVVVNTGTRIGDNVILNTSSSIDHHCSVGDHVHIAPGGHLGGAVRVGEGALLGIGVSVIPCMKVGVWAIVGAGSVVVRDVPAHVTVIGSPARVIKEHPAGPI
jgi:sugar O-acyltransferase (sialic acid O-acetyltransferase NeuD family)